jgi:hypothetical protein
MKLKTLLLTILLFFCMTAVAVAGCIIPQGTKAWLFDGVSQWDEVTAAQQVKAELSEKQPPAKWLSDFGRQCGQDYSDGVVVQDEFGYFLLLHKDQLVCGDSDSKKE